EAEGEADAGDHGDDVLDDGRQPPQDHQQQQVEGHREQDGTCQGSSVHHLALPMRPWGLTSNARIMTRKAAPGPYAGLTKALETCHTMPIVKAPSRAP